MRKIKLFENFKTGLDFDSLYEQAPEELKNILDELSRVEQRLDFHPEGDTLTHTKTVTNRLAKYNDINLSLAGVFHDIGKKDTAKIGAKGFPQHPGHEMASLRYIERYKNWIEEMGGDYETILNIVKNHMKMKLMDQMREVKRKAVEALPEYPQLVKFSDADHGGTDI